MRAFISESGVEGYGTSIDNSASRSRQFRADDEWRKRWYVSRTGRAAALVVRHGVGGFVQECYYRSLDHYYEWYFGVETGGLTSKEELDLCQEEWHEFSSVYYQHIFNVLKRLPVETRESVFLDYGCGNGRALVAAASIGYRRIIGIEVSRLVDLARINVGRMRHRKAFTIELKQCDATDFAVPSDVNIIYFYNPFRGATLEAVLKNIHNSYLNAKRKIFIVYFNNGHFDKVVSCCQWLTKRSQEEVYCKTSCAVYETSK